MFILAVIIFSILVIAIGLVTARLNVKVPCDHHWEDIDGDLKCKNCFRVIRQASETSPATDENQSLARTNLYLLEEMDEESEMLEEA